jgi:hypothetical protein
LQANYEKRAFSPALILPDLSKNIIGDVPDQLIILKI